MRRGSLPSQPSWLPETSGTDQCWVSCFVTFDFVCFLKGRKPPKVTRVGADPTWKAMWRFIRTWICHNHKLYYTYILLSAMTLYTVSWHLCVGYYRRRNHHRSLDYAIQMEKEWDLIKPKEDEDEDEE